MGNTTTERLARAGRTAGWVSLALRVGLIGAILAVSAAPVLGQDDEKAVKKIIELNKKALISIDAMEFETARDGLLQAVTIAKQANLVTHKMLARTYVHLGAVYFMGFNDRPSATRYFGLAKGVRADINLTPSLATPALTAVFDAATAGAAATEPATATPKSGRRAPQPARTPTPAPSPEPVIAPAMPAPAPGVEPELPVVLPADLYCPAVEEAPEGQEIALRCVAKPILKAERVLLYFRASGAPSYSVAAMQSSTKGWLVASIPAEAVTGESLQYYCEAHDSADNVVATSGQEELPNAIIIKPAAASATSTSAAVAAGKGDGEDPLKRIKDEQISDVREQHIHRRRQHAFWAGAGAGSGFGYHNASLFEWRKDARPGASKGTRVAGTFTAYPEIGFLITDHIGVAVQGRLEYISIQGSGDQTPGSPAKGAISVLGRGLYYLDLGAGNAQVQFSLDLGGGEGYRFAYPPTNPNHTTVTVKDSQGNVVHNPDGTAVTTTPPTLRTDTIRSGPILYGAGVGFIYHFTHWVAANVELRFLGAGPHLGLLGEGYASLQFSLGGRAPAKSGDAPPSEQVIEEEEDE
jgi:hypothetical protein